MKSLVAAAQKLGQSLLLPIAVLPVAGLALRLGQPDLLNIAPMTSAGGAVFANLGLLLAVGVAVGLARANNGAAGVAALVGFVVASKGAELLLRIPAQILSSFPATQIDLAVAAYKAQTLTKLGVPIGIVSGIIAGTLYNRYSDLRLPGALTVFAGRRFVSVASAFFGILVAFAVATSWPAIEAAMDTLGYSAVDAGSLGLFIFGVLNRILLVTGLQHIINNVAWFLGGEYHGVSGDLKRFMAGDPSAGAFMSGFFPVMMFGLPAACLAMYRAASPGRKRTAGGLLLAMALTSFLTGITEPIEFTLMFLAPILFLLHALLTGTAMVVMDLLDIHLGFSFRAGLFDYVINFGRATQPWLLLPVGAVYFLVYYSVFHFLIVHFDMKTIGRVEDSADGDPGASAAADARRTDQFIAALGGRGNLRSVDSCATRLRLEVANRKLINTRALRRMGASGVTKSGKQGLQVVLGPVAEQIASHIRARLAGPRESDDLAVAYPRRSRARDASGSGPVSETLPSAAQVIAALGGRANVVQVESVTGRVLIRVADTGTVDEEALRGLGVRGVAILEPERVHLLHASAAALESRLGALLT